MSRKPPSVEEEKRLYAFWDRGTFGTVEESVDYHHGKHGRGMTRWQYLRRAAAFNRAAARRSIDRDTITYTHSNGEYLKERNGKILSYKPPRSDHGPEES